MHISKIEIFLVEIPYKSPYKTSTNTTKKGRHILLKATATSGQVGWGETGIISQRYPAQGDSPETIFAALNYYLAPAILGEGCLNAEMLMHKLDQLIRGHYFAKCAIDHAMLDLQGKLLGISVSDILGGAHRLSYAVSRSLPLAEPREVVERAVQLRDEGYSRLTLKGSGNVSHDYSCFSEVRKELGPSYELEIDPNGAYGVNAAVSLIKKLEGLGIYAVEQPTPGEDISALAAVKEKTCTPIIADESLFTQRDLREIIHKNAADTVCLKPFKSGGLLAAKKMQVIAECFNLEVSTGSMHPFGIGTAALHHFACGIPDLMTAGYGSPLERFEDDVLDESCFEFSNGIVRLKLDRPGLGIVVNEAKVEKYSTKYSLVQH